MRLRSSPWEGVPDNYLDYVGFVYLITSPEGKMYVGKKLFQSKLKRAPKAGFARNRRVVTESNWKAYFGSCAELVKDLKKTGKSGWKRQILYLCKTRSEMSYLELREQMDRNVLQHKHYYNGQIHVRLNERVMANCDFPDRCSPYAYQLYI